MPAAGRGTVTDGGARSGRTWSAPWPAEPWRWRHRSSCGSEPLERGEQVVVGSGAELHDHDAGRGVRHEDRQQAVAGAGHEPLAFLGDVEAARDASRCGS